MVNISLANKIFLLAFISAILTLFLLSNPIKDPYQRITLSIGVLAIVGIFVPFLIKSEIKKKSKKYIANKWKKVEPDFKRLQEEIINELGKQDRAKIDSDLITGDATDLSNIAGSIGLHELDFDKAVKRSVLFFSVVLIASLFDIATNLNWKFLVTSSATTPITFPLISSIGFGFGIYYFFKIFIIWFELSNFD